MKRIFFVLYSLLLVPFMGQAMNQDQFHDNELYIMLQPASAQTLITAGGQCSIDIVEAYFSGALGQQKLKAVSAPFQVAKGSPLQRVIRLTFEDAVALDLLQSSLAQYEGVDYVEKIPLDRTCDGVFDTYEPDDLGINAMTGQWYLYKVSAPAAWYFNKGDREVKVAVVDNAVFLNHPDLRDNLWVNTGEIPGNGIDDDGNGFIDDVHGYDVADNDGDPNPIDSEQSHGTHVAGLVGATSDNQLGIASIGFEVSLISVKCGRGNNRTLFNTYDGVLYAVAAGADIINCSWGSPQYSEIQKQVIQYALDQGCVVVAAAGNDAVETKFYPAAYPGVIVVGSTNRNDRVSDFSNYGNWISVMAPGTDIRSTVPDSGYALQSGTSMASPIVAGLAGLMKAYYPQITVNELRACILSTTDSLEYLNAPRYLGKIGTGRINAYQAMRCVDSLRGGVTGIEQMEQELKQSGLLIYPNPASREIMLAAALTGKAGVQIILTDISGRRVWQTEQSTGQYQGSRTIYRVALPSLAPGLYQVTLQSGKDQVTGKVILK